MEQLSYQQRLQQSEQQRKDSELSLLVREKSAQLSQDIVATERSLFSKQIELERALGSENLDFKKIVDLQSDIEGIENGLEKLESLKQVLFPEVPVKKGK